jgi:outer membrane biosynthesis protein TonB
MRRWCWSSFFVCLLAAGCSTTRTTAPSASAPVVQPTQTTSPVAPSTATPGTISPTPSASPAPVAPPKPAATPTPAPAPVKPKPAAPTSIAKAKPAPTVSAPAAAPPSVPPPSSSAPAKAPATPTLNLADLEQRLRDTKAIGVFTKLSLKNQVDDLLDEFRDLYKGQAKQPSAALRQHYDLLLLKVLTLLQDSDPPLAAAISSSREAIWGILADPDKFAKI